MKAKKLLIYSALLCCSLAGMSGCKKKKDEHTLELRNLYFSDWDGEDPYTQFIEEKFDVEIKPSSYGYNDWGTQVTGEVNGNTIGDVFHFDLESFNFGNTYMTWAKGGIIKALPNDLSKWPKVKAAIESASNIHSLEVDGKLYGIPIVYNQDDPSKDYSTFTYVYRKDWLRQLDASKVHEDDVYTWQEFLDIIELFGTTDAIPGKDYAIGDINWGFPSLTNFYKNSPHCFSLQPDGSVVNNFTTTAYKQGLDITRDYYGKGYYYQQHEHVNDEKANTESFVGGHLGILYDNFNLENYSKLRKNVRNGQQNGISDDALNEWTAIMKVKGPDGNFHLEGSENWFSMTFFNADISDAKQEKILDILDYLLGEEGTRLAIWGKENSDYIMVDGEPETLWERKPNGEYPPISNGAKYLRKMITLSNDTTDYDPFTDQKSYQIIKNWQDAMNTAKNNNQLVTFMEPANVKWLSTELKDMYSSALINEGNANALNYCVNTEGYETWDKYVAKFNIAKWTNTIAEVNRAIGH